MILACPSYFDHIPLIVNHPDLSAAEAPHALLAALRSIVPGARIYANVLAGLHELGWQVFSGQLPDDVQWLDVPWDAFRLSGFDAMALTAVDYPLSGMPVIATTRPNLFTRELVDSKYRIPPGLLILVNDEGLAVFPDDRPWSDDGTPTVLGCFRMDPRQFASLDLAHAAASRLSDAGYLVDINTTPVEV